MLRVLLGSENWQRADHYNNVVFDGSAIYYLVRDLGHRASINARPHGIRHAAITEALDITGGDVRAVQKFSMHQNIQTVTVYDNNRQDFAGEVAKKIAESV